MGVVTMAYKLSKSGKGCSVCGGEFETDAEFFSAIFEVEEEWDRKDYCPTCWGTGNEEAFSHWRSKVRPPEEKRAAFEMDRVLGLFDRVSEGDSESRDRLRYLLALMLVRKRVFKFVGTASGEEEGIRVFCPEREQEYPVRDPGLDAEEIEKARNELGALLDLDL